jgi:hypothetical protein
MRSIYRLFSTLYPGAYRFIAINAIIYYCIPSVSAFFSEAFFMVSLLTAFSGMAVASQAYTKENNLKFTHMLFLIIGLLTAASLAGTIIWRGSYEEYLVVITAALTYSIFSFSRAALAAEGEFKLLTIAGVLAFSVLIPVLYMARDNSLLLTMLIFSSQMLLVLIVGYGKIFGNVSVNYSIAKDVGSYSLSNGFSSGLSFIVPLVLIGEYGENSSASIAQIFTLSTLLFSYPRFLSAGFMVDFKRDPTRVELVHDFNQKVFIFIFIAIPVYMVVAYYFKVELFDFMLLFIAMQLSQLSLPYANIHMVLGKGGALLKVNYLTITALATMTILLFVVHDAGEKRGQFLMMLYCFFMFLRYFMTKFSAKKIIISSDCFL